MLAPGKLLAPGTWYGVVGMLVPAPNLGAAGAAAGAFAGEVPAPGTWYGVVGMLVPDPNLGAFGFWELALFVCPVEVCLNVPPVLVVSGGARALN